MNVRVLFCAVCLIGFPAITQAAVWHVDDDNTTGVEDGSTQHPYDSLQEAMARATAGDQIRLAAGS